MRRYTIEIDDAPVGSIRRGETAEFDVRPGSHEVRLTVDWASSPTVVITVGDGERIILTAGPGGTAWSGLKHLADRPESYINLEVT